MMKKHLALNGWDFNRYAVQALDAGKARYIVSKRRAIRVFVCMLKGDVL